MRVYKTKWFSRFVRRERLTQHGLVEAIQRAQHGRVDADLGGGLIKQRVARQGHGRSGGYRMIVAYRENDRAIFLFGFAKNEQDNINSDDLADLRQLASSWLHAQTHQIVEALEKGAIEEIEYDEDATAR